MGVGKQLSTRSRRPRRWECKLRGGGARPASWTRNEGTDGAVLRRGAVDGVGRCTGIGVKEEERGARNGGVGAVDG